MDGGDPVVVREPASLALADGDQRYVRELPEEFGRPGGVEPAVERGDDRRRAVARHREGRRLEVRVDDVEPGVLAPDRGNRECNVIGYVAAVAHRPQALWHDRHEFAIDLRIAGGEERDLVAAAVQLLHERGDHALRAGIASRGYGEHRRHGDADPKGFHDSVMLVAALAKRHGPCPGPLTK